MEKLINKSENEIEKAKEKEVKSLDDVLLESVGKWGWFQVWFFGLVINFYLAAYAPGVYGAMFTDFKPKHHCSEDEGEVFNFTKWEDESHRCHSLAENGSLVPCSLWAYDTTYFTETLSMKYDIVCDNAYLGTLSGTLRMFGLLIGSLVFGWLSDIIGRVPTITLAGFCLFAGQVVAVFSVNYFMFSLCNMFIAAGGVGSYIVGFVILFEWLSPDWRSFGSIYSQIPFGIGFLYTIFLGYVTSDWVTMQWIMAAPNIIFFLLYPLVPESPRWLVSVGKMERARKAIGVAAKSNGLPTPEYIPIDESSKTESVTETGSIGLMSHKKLFGRLIVMSLEWIVITLCFYGLSFNSGKLELFVGTGLMAGVECLAYVIILFTIDIADRRPVLAFCQILGGVSCVCAGFVPAQHYWVRLGLALVGKMGASAAFGVVFLYTAELFHTPIRNSAMGMCSTMARVGALLAPTIADLDSVAAFLPFVIMGGGAIVVGLLAFLLPETRGHNLPETLEEAEALGK